MTEAALIDLLLAMLVRSTGRPRGEWRRILGRAKVYPLSSHPHCNWEFQPSGSIRDVETVQRSIDRMRSAHPHVTG